MAATTSSRAARDDTVDVSGANFIGLLCSAVMFIAFIFMPWHGTKLVDNVAKLLADLLSGVPAAPVARAPGRLPLVSGGGGGLSRT
jgi:hypothetical protein